MYRLYFGIYPYPVLFSTYVPRVCKFEPKGSWAISALHMRDALMLLHTIDVVEFGQAVVTMLGAFLYIIGFFLSGFFYKVFFYFQNCIGLIYRVFKIFIGL